VNSPRTDASSRLDSQARNRYCTESVVPPVTQPATQPDRDRPRIGVIRTVRTSLAMLPPDLRRWWLAVPLLGAATGAAEGGGAAAIFGLIKIISDPAQANTLPVAARIMPLLPRHDHAGLILQFALLVALYHFAKNLLVVGAQYANHRIVGKSSAALAGSVLRSYLLAPYPFHFHRHAAELIRNTTHSVTTVFTALGSAAAIISELLIGTAIIAVLLAAAPVTTLVTGSLLGALMVLLLRALRRMARRAGSERHQLERGLLQTLQQTFAAIKEIKALGREDFFYRAYAEQQRRVVSLGYLGVTLQALPPLVVETVFVWGALLVIALLAVSGRVEAEGLPLLGLFAYAGFRLIPMANRVTWRLNEIRASAASVHALDDDYRLLSGRNAADEDGDADGMTLRSAIVLERVSYAYPGSSAPALDQVSLTIRRGESIGFVGPTGAGKSTLVDVIVGLLPPSDGRVLVDDVELTTPRGRRWRRRVGYVPQSIVLIDDSLRRNIALGVAEPEIDAARLAAAARVAQLEPLIAALPDGLETATGERGVRLSGGERQRIGIARALYHDPDVLLLDEATAALDGATEAALGDALRALRGDRTVLLVAHRLSTVRGCDRIALVIGGRLADCGTFDELLARSREFRVLAETTGQAE
jgi:ATP-binding cassette, subfamily B, bacterial PglK